MFLNEIVTNKANYFTLFLTRKPAVYIFSKYLKEVMNGIINEGKTLRQEIHILATYFRSF